MKKINKWLIDNLAWLILLFVGVVIAVFLLLGNKAEDGTITLDAKPAQISDSTKQFIEDSKTALSRIMNVDKPTDEATEEAANGEGKGFYTTIDDVLGRMLQDGNNDNGAGWQCSRYTGWLGTGQWSYSSANPDYGPRNGKDMAQYLVDNFGYKYHEPVRGAIGSGGFNTTYGHTALFLYWIDGDTAMVQDANYVPLTVSTHPMDVDGWTWVVPGSYNPAPEPEPTPTPTPEPDSKEVTYSYVPGDSFGRVLLKLGLSDGTHLWGTGGDVEYYTRQLVEQNVLDRRGNVLLYTPFILPDSFTS